MYKPPCKDKAAIALSFDYETSAVYMDVPHIYCRAGAALDRLIGRFAAFKGKFFKNCSIGYANRLGAGNIIEALRKYNIHATWFATGHALLKENKNKDSFRINQKLPYATPIAGFSDLVTWRQGKPTFFYEPYSDCKSYPWWYMGDQASRLRMLGEDIQCHTFSHPYIALEAPENIEMDIKDWQSAAEKNGFARASIMSFPFEGDVFKFYDKLNLKAAIGSRIDAQSYTVRPLSEAAVDIYKQNGIELVTRCASKAGQQAQAFLSYNDTGLYFIPDINIGPCIKQPRLFDGILEEIEQKRLLVNLWTHPANILDNTEKENFEYIVKRLIASRDRNKSRIGTILEFWKNRASE